MEGDVFAAMLIVAAGTYVMRAVPLAIAVASRSRIFTPDASGLLSMMAASLISALLVVSAMPEQQNLAPRELLARTIAIIAVFLSQLRWRNLGVAVVSGVAVYAVLRFFVECLEKAY